MADDVMVAPGGEAGLSQVERVVDVFVAPSKTFTDILRSTSWWLPFLLMVIVTLGSAYSIDKKVTFEAVSEAEIAKSSMGADRINSLPADQRATVMQRQAVITKYTTYASFIFILIFVALEALVLWASFNFGLGAKLTFGQVFAVVMYSALPRLFVGLLSIVLLFAGVGTENFDLRNPVGTNIGYYLTSPALRAGGAFFDIFGLWCLFLLILGMSIVSKKTMGQSAAVILGWWVLILLLSVGFTAAFS